MIIQPDADYTVEFLQNTLIFIDNIIETKAGMGNSGIPEWLSAYLRGGNEEAERITYFEDKYLFIGKAEGRNLNTLSKWAENFSVVYDFPNLAASRIEKKMIMDASLFPDDEYGEFYETMVKRAYNGEYPDALLEDTFWIKQVTQNNNNEEIYQYFLLISTDKFAMQVFILNMIHEVQETVSVNRQQNNAIRRLQQNFFNGF